METNTTQQPSAGSEGWNFKTEQGLQTLAFVLVLLRMIGLFPWQNEETVFEMAVHRSPRSCSTQGKPLPLGTSIGLLSLTFVVTGSQTFMFVRLQYHLIESQVREYLFHSLQTRENKIQTVLCRRSNNPKKAQVKVSELV